MASAREGGGGKGDQQGGLPGLENWPLPEAMALPAYRLHQLKGDRKGTWSVWVSGNLRLTFEI